jgi:hypothetical protein
MYRRQFQAVWLVVVMFLVAGFLASSITVAEETEPVSDGAGDQVQAQGDPGVTGEDEGEPTEGPIPDPSEVPATEAPVIPTPTEQPPPGRVVLRLTVCCEDFDNSAGGYTATWSFGDLDENNPNELIASAMLMDDGIGGVSGGVEFLSEQLDGYDEVCVSDVLFRGNDTIKLEDIQPATCAIFTQLPQPGYTLLLQFDAGIVNQPVPEPTETVPTEPVPPELGSGQPSPTLPVPTSGSTVVLPGSSGAVTSQVTAMPSTGVQPQTGTPALVWAVMGLSMLLVAISAVIRKPR